LGEKRLIKAVVFDFDGLIFDTETPEYLSFQQIYQSYGIELELAVWSRWVGTDSSAFNPYDFLDECVGRSLDREQIRSRRKITYNSLIAKEKVRPGVEAYLKAAKQLGLKVGLASSSSRLWVMDYLNQLDLTAFFDCIRVREDVGQVKPDPELYLQVLNKLGVAPSEAIALEDSPNGALAAKRAGMKCVIVPNDVTKNSTFCEVDLRLQSLAQIELEALIQTLK
jgi:HAD superfamily hydrolase (TIGR01509 family)